MVLVVLVLIVEEGCGEANLVFSSEWGFPRGVGIVAAATCGTEQ